MADQLLLEEVILDRIKNNAVVNAVLGSGSNCRVYPLAAPQFAEYPCVIYERESSNYSSSMSGDSNFNTGMFEVTIIAESFLTARNLSGNIRLALSGLRGSFTISAKTLVINRFVIESDEDMYVEPVEGKEYGLWTNVCKYSYSIILETPTLD